MSINLTTDGTTPFEIIPLNTIIDTTISGIDDVQTVQIEDGPADLNIKTTVFSDNGNNWSLGTGNGDNQVVWEYSKEGSSWTVFETADTLYPLSSNLAAGGTQDIYFRLTMPTATASSNEYGSTVTIMATEP